MLIPRLTVPEAPSSARLGLLDQLAIRAGRQFGDLAGANRRESPHHPYDPDPLSPRMQGEPMLACLGVNFGVVDDLAVLVAVGVSRPRPPCCSLLLGLLLLELGKAGKPVRSYLPYGLTEL